MKFDVFRTDKANDELYDIIQYIADDSGSVDTVLDYLAKLERAILLLADAPYMGSIPHYSILKKQGYRVLAVEKHLVFYKVDEAASRVTIYAVVRSRREYRNLV